MLPSCRYPGGLMLQSCRYPGPSGWEWGRNSEVLPLVVLVLVNQVCSSFSVSAVVCRCFDYLSILVIVVLCYYAMLHFTLSV